VFVTAKVCGHADEMTVKGMIRNAGRFEATITDIYLTWAQHEAIRVIREKGFREAATMVSVPPRGHLIGMSLPQVIKAQSRVEYMITGLSAIDPRLPHDVKADAVLRVGFKTAAGDWAACTVRPRYRRVSGATASTA
jgi:hypothetical protein